IGCCFHRQIQSMHFTENSEQDTPKTEDKAHKAATKIQASFRGHITRKKLKGEKKGEPAAATTQEAANAAVPGSEAKTHEAEKTASSSAAAPSANGKETATENVEKAAPIATDEKTTASEKDAKETGSDTSAAAESTPSSNVISNQEKEKKQAEASAAEAASKAQTETTDSSTAPDSAEETKLSESVQHEEVKGDGSKDAEENA
uniref:Neuromodulin n=1 Tax=Callorhinchus milii TaxID=7868 RepID=A0A4W3HA03_CALMI